MFSPRLPAKWQISAETARPLAPEFRGGLRGGMVTGVAGVLFEARAAKCQNRYPSPSPRPGQTPAGSHFSGTGARAFADGGGKAEKHFTLPACRGKHDGEGSNQKGSEKCAGKSGSEQLPHSLCCQPAGKHRWNRRFWGRGPVPGRPWFWAETPRPGRCLAPAQTYIARTQTPTSARGHLTSAARGLHRVYRAIGELLRWSFFACRRETGNCAPCSTRF